MMPLLNGGLLLRYINNYRGAWVAGRYGGGKTSLSFRIAYDLMRTGKFRYLLSNVKSVWCDDPATVQLIDSRVDAVIVLDEAGEFISTRSQAREWLAFLRKMNIVLLLPSVLPPSSDFRFLEIRRTFNASAIGADFWLYSSVLSSGSIEEKIRFGWLNPSEIYGVYDSDGFPSDATELLDYTKKWLEISATERGYTAPRQQKSIFGGAGLDASAISQLSELVDDVGGAVDEFAVVQKQAEKTVSLLRGKKSRR